MTAINKTQPPKANLNGDTSHEHVGDILSIRYNNSFEKILDDIDNSKPDKTVKIFQAPMGFGKTHHLITKWLPYVFKKTDVKVQIVTAPLTDIVSDNLTKLIKTGNRNGFIGTDNLELAIDLIEDGESVVLYVTNKMLFAQDSDLPNRFKELLVKTEFAIYDDEFHSWTCSATSKEDPDAYKWTNGHNDGGKYKACMYKTLLEFSKHTSYLFGITATPNIEVKGLRDTYGELNYVLVNKNSLILPIELRDRSAHMGKVVWRTNETQLINIAIEDTEYLEAKTGYKTVTMYACQSDREGNVTWEDVLKHLQSHINVAEDVESIAVSINNKIRFYTKDGQISNTNDASIFKRANDLNDPLRHIIVVDKFKMGINIAPLKNLVMLKKTDAKNPDGEPVIENGQQNLGRLIRPNAGVSSKDFWGKYGGKLSNCPKFPKEINLMNFYMMDTPMWREAIQEFEKNIAPSSVEYDETEFCPTCGQEVDETNLTKHVQNHYNVDINDKITKILDKEFFNA